MRLWRAHLAAGVVLGWFTGCGYRFVSGGAPFPEGVDRACVPMFTNRSAEPALEAIFTQALRERLVRAGRLGGKDCPASIRGEILSVWGSPTISDRVGLVAYRMFATLGLKLVKGERVVSEIQVTGSEDYLPGSQIQPDGTEFRGDVLLTEASRQTALRRLADTLVRDGYDRLTSGW